MRLGTRLSLSLSLSMSLRLSLWLCGVEKKGGHCLEQYLKTAHLQRLLLLPVAVARVLKGVSILWVVGTMTGYYRH